MTGRAVSSGDSGTRGRRVLAIAVTGLVLWACADGGSTTDGDGWAGTLDTLSSGRIVASSPDVPAWTDDEAWTLREVFRVGSLTAEGPELFGQVGDVEIGLDGELYVLDGQASDVRVFGPDGEYLRTLGGPGEGPGELNRPAGMALDRSGHVWVMNWGNSRYTAYVGATGEIHDERRRLASFGMFPWPGGFDDGGRLIDVGLTPDGRGSALLLLDTAFVPADTLLMPELDERYRIAFRVDGQMRMSTPDPFAPRPFWSARPQGGIVVGEGDAYRLHRIGFDGDTTLTMVLARERVPITSAERDSAMAAFTQMSELAGGATPDREPRALTEKPAHGPLFVDDGDRTWVSATRPSGAPFGWDVFGSDGRFRGTVTLPVSPGFVTPSARGGRLAVATNVDGAPVVVVYEIVAGGGGA